MVELVDTLGCDPSEAQAQLSVRIRLVTPKHSVGV